eukprot:TRINITY_DN529_c0_g1_i3.p3 TRINITY_DN529_c0_g1~~TRINITY_DN529_c0_g1_i3.p3  ORF type:complete len:210 (+),score=22.70 TRINITY_DN529_c0_g1_i3:102-731(+)
MSMIASGGVGVILSQLQQVGLQLLVNPATSAPVMMGACALTGVVYPTYASFKAMESKQTKDDTQWLTYWTMYGSVSLGEHYTDNILGWFPWYYHAKFAFFLWLQLPTTRGAELLYTRFYRPYLLKYQEKIDLVLQYWFQVVGQVLETPMAKMLYAQLGVMFMSLYNSVTWFLEDPDKNKEQKAIQDDKSKDQQNGANESSTQQIGGNQS